MVVVSTSCGGGANVDVSHFGEALIAEPSPAWKPLSSRPRWGWKSLFRVYVIRLRFGDLIRTILLTRHVMSEAGSYSRLTDLCFT